MKKLLVLTLVLGVVSVASAVIEISIDGDPCLADLDIWLDPSDSLALGIYGDVPAVGVYWMMVVDSAMGSLSGGAVQQGDASSIFPQFYATDYFLYYIGREGDSAVSGCVTNLFSPLSGLLVDQVDFHLEASGDMAISLYCSPDSADWSVEDSLWILEDTVSIRQIPEPMTIGLLGLGGLMLRKKR